MVPPSCYVEPSALVIGDMFLGDQRSIRMNTIVCGVSAGGPQPGLGWRQNELGQTLRVGSALVNTAKKLKDVFHIVADNLLSMRSCFG